MRAQRFPTELMRRLAALLAGAACVTATTQASALEWAGHTWQVTSGGMAGVCNGNPANVSVDSNGYLHLHIAHDGGTWSAAELFTTDRLGFGTYQWQVEGPIDKYDKNVVLGLFPYGPQAGIGADGTNEIDIEYSRWGQANGENGDYTDYPASGTTIGELSYTFTLAGLESTSRFVWSTASITDFLFDGFVPITKTSGSLKTWTYAPSNPTQNVPQQALPLGMNLWCFDAPPSDANPVEIVIHSFEFVPEGTAAGGASDGGAAGEPSMGGAPAAGRGGAGAGGRIGTAGRANAGGNGGQTGGAGAVNGGQTAGGAFATGGRGGANAAGAGATVAGAGTAGTSASASGGAGNGAAGKPSGGQAGTPADSSGHSSGCGCRVVASSSVPSTAVTAWLGVLAFVVRRAARRRKPSQAPRV